MLACNGLWILCLETFWILIRLLICVFKASREFFRGLVWEYFLNNPFTSHHSLCLHLGPPCWIWQQHLVVRWRVLSHLNTTEEEVRCGHFWVKNYKQSSLISCSWCDWRCLFLFCFLIILLFVCLTHSCEISSLQTFLRRVFSPLCNPEEPPVPLSFTGKPPFTQPKQPRLSVKAETS